MILHALRARIHLPYRTLRSLWRIIYVRSLYQSLVRLQCYVVSGSILSFVHRKAKIGHYPSQTTPRHSMRRSLVYYNNRVYIFLERLTVMNSAWGRLHIYIFCFLLAYKWRTFNVHSVRGPVINPHQSAASQTSWMQREQRSAGGSSGGSAAAVAAGLCDACDDCQWLCSPNIYVTSVHYQLIREVLLDSQLLTVV